MLESRQIRPLIHEDRLEAPVIRELGMAPAGATPDQPPDWMAYASSLRRHRWGVLFIVILGAVAGVLGATVKRPQYAAQSVLWIETPDAATVGGAAGVGKFLDSTSWRELITTSAVLDSVVRSLRTYLSPRTVADARALARFDVGPHVEDGEYRLEVREKGTRFTLRREGEVVDAGSVGDSIGRPVGFRWQPTATELGSADVVRFEIVAPVDAVTTLAHDLRVDAHSGTSFLRLELRGPVAARTASILNAVVHRSVDVAATLKRQRLLELERILGEHARHSERELRGNEAALAQFRVNAAKEAERAGVLPAAAGAHLDAIGTESVDLDQVRRDRARLEGLLAESGAGAMRVEALAGLIAVRDAPRMRGAVEEATRREAELRALRYKYTEESAPVVEARAAYDTLVRTVIPALTRDLVAELRARERNSRPRVDSVLARLRVAPVAAITEARLERGVREAEAISVEVGERYQANRLALLSSLPDLRIVDEAAVPQTSLIDLRPLLVFVAVVTSFLLAAFGARLRDGLDSRLRTPEQVTAGMRLPILACLPRVVEGTNGLDVSREETVEALRSLRVRLLTAPRAGPLCLTVTSPSPGDGKSFLAVNLALSFERAGHRVALVDGDARRGILHRVLGAAPRPGLIEVLDGTASLGESMQATEYPRLRLLAAGSRTIRAPELLLGLRLRELIDDLRGSYDVIIVDSPPLAAGVDALVLATVTTNLLVVLRNGATDVRLAAAKLEQIDAHPVRLVGAVLNDVRDDTEFRPYAYSGADYASSDEAYAPDDPEPQRLLGGRP